jgi:hypothetical protein
MHAGKSMGIMTTLKKTYPRKGPWGWSTQDTMPWPAWKENRMKIKELVGALVVSVALHAGMAVANQVVSEVGRIVQLETGWSQDTMAIFLDVPTVNPGCPILDAGYALDPKDPGVRAHEAALLGAYLSGKRVYIRADGCVFGKPKVIAVGIVD